MHISIDGIHKERASDLIVVDWSILHCIHTPTDTTLVTTYACVATHITNPDIVSTERRNILFIVRVLIIGKWSESIVIRIEPSSQVRTLVIEVSHTVPTSHFSLMYKIRRVLMKGQVRLLLRCG
jgi:hypothetical protein